MQSINLIIHLTGLLLFSPSSSSGAYPIEVLMPTETSGMKAHIPELGWHTDTAEECQEVDFTRWVEEEELCYVSLRGLAVTLGDGGLPLPNRLPTMGLPFISTSAHPVKPEWLTGVPTGRIRSRVRLTSGSAVNGCPFALWEFGGGVTIFDNIVTWVTTGISGEDLTISGTDASGTNPLVTLSPDPDGTIELWIRNEPKIPQSPAPTEAIHYQAIYDLLGFTTTEQREIPRVHTPIPGLGCGRWGRKAPPLLPGTPTCMPAAGSPLP